VNPPDQLGILLLPGTRSAFFEAASRPARRWDRDRDRRRSLTSLASQRSCRSITDELEIAGALHGRRSRSSNASATRCACRRVLKSCSRPDPAASDRPKAVRGIPQYYGRARGAACRADRSRHTPARCDLPYDRRRRQRAPAARRHPAQATLLGHLRRTFPGSRMSLSMGGVGATSSMCAPQAP